MQKQPQSDRATIDNMPAAEQDSTEELAEIYTPEYTPRRRFLNAVLWIVAVLVIIGFAFFGVTALQHHPPLPSDTTGAVYHVLASVTSPLL
ncbi:hypothetical protein [Dictyobacter arantiisoli]|uniref:Uncharacterized protein n=1 Tax=Dictyobacter arantiisoli TaxID=2014874 RepID=A0A5A5TIE9_9CHLR|nr:hypothetical protein [Dictyobacter arantiisoli]GCF11381.1 hypothetical protein KDI_49450 [Dictyobacter arantiisoli]